jgi:hypothetical protein
MIVISLLLIAGVAAGIAWPLIQRLRARVMGASPVGEAVATPVGLRAGGATEVICPYCSKMNVSARKLCTECSNPLPVADFASLMEGVERDELVREVTIAGLLFVCMLIAMCVSSWLPMVGKVVILLLTCGTLVFRFFRTLSEG